MQAILTKYIPATNHRGSRIKASCERGSIMVSAGMMAGSVEENHIEAAGELVAKFVKEDVKRYATQDNPWNSPRVVGCLPTGDYCHVFHSVK